MATKPDLSGAAFGDVDRTGYSASFISYLDCTRIVFEPIKRSSFELLRLRAGQKVLDVGCGVGDDVLELSAQIAPNGLAAGLDRSESMIAEARRRARLSGAWVEFEIGDAEHLPWRSSFFDACRADRLLQHVANPEAAFQELVRVLRPSGRVVVTDRDWSGVALGSADEGTTQLILGRAAAGIRNPWVGRKLVGFARSAGLEDVRVLTHSVEIRSFEMADSLLDLITVAEHVIEEGRVSRTTIEEWLNDLQDRDRRGLFFATMTLISVSGVRP